MRRQSRALTIIELLIVVAIVAILAAIAIPNFLEAQVRSKVSAAKSNLRVVVGGLEAYAIDHNSYPPTRALIPGDPLQIFSDHQLSVLTTPIEYVSAGSFRDPFGRIQAQGAYGRIHRQDFPELLPPNQQRSLLYYHYPSIARRLDDRRLHIAGASVVSIGPDLQDSLGAFRPFSPSLFREFFSTSRVGSPSDTIYDPTNGTVSAGDIANFAGEAGRYRQP